MTGRQNGFDHVRFDSNISNVEVVCGEQRIFTPGSIPLKRSESHNCIAQQKGYESKKFTIHSRSGGRGFGASTGANFFIGLITFGIGLAVGWLVDWPSGAMRNLQEKDIFLELKLEGETSTAKKVLKTAATVGKALITMPQNVVRQTASAVLDASVGKSGQILPIGQVASKGQDSDDGSI